VTSYPDIDVIVVDILGTMVGEPSGIRRGLRTLLPDVDDARTSELLEVWYRHVDEQQQEVLAGRRAYASSTVIDLDAVTRVAADADLSDADAFARWWPSGSGRSRGRTLSRRWTGSPRDSRWSACRTPATRRSPASARRASLPRELGSE